MNAVFPDLDCKQGTKAVPPVPHRLLTDINAPFVEYIFERLANVGRSW